MSNDITVYLFQTASQQPKDVSQAAHSFVRRHIAQITDRDPDRLVFGRTKQGKPYAQNAGICFNLSHSGNMVAAAFAECEIGVDIEAVRPVNLRIAEGYFTESDRRYLAQAVDEQERRYRFFALWTAKEAYLKLHGAGLSGGLGFSVAEERGLLTTVVSERFPAAEVFHRFISGERFGTDSGCDAVCSLVQYSLSLCSDRINNVIFEHDDLTNEKSFYS